MGVISVCDGFSVKNYNTILPLPHQPKVRRNQNVNDDCSK